MKSLRYIGALAIAGMGLLAAACDTIEKDDYKNPYTGIISSDRYVLLEDYTGVRCTNCPTAAAEIARLQEFYGANLIVVGMHPNGVTMAMPHSGDPDLRTDAAKEYFDGFQMTSLPAGLVNRKPTIYGYAEWGGAVAEVISNELTYATLSVSAALGSGDTTLSINVSGEFIEDYKEDGAINVLTMILEDSIVVKQSNKDPSLGGAELEGYVQNHVLRQVVGSTWGDRVLGEAPDRGSAVAAAYNVSLNPAWRTNHLSVVVALVNADSREVIQAAQVHVE